MYAGKPANLLMPEMADTRSRYRSIGCEQIGEIQRRCRTIWTLMERFPMTAKPVRDELQEIIAITRAVDDESDSIL